MNEWITKVKAVRTRTWIIVAAIFVGLAILSSILEPKKEYDEAKWNKFLEVYEQQNR